MAFYSAEGGVQLVQIIEMQAFKGDVPCYKIRFQGNNLDKTMVEEKHLMDLKDAPSTGDAAPGANPLVHHLPRGVASPGKKKKKKVTGMGKKKKKASRSLSPSKMKKAAKMKKNKGPTRGMRRSSSWDPQDIAAASKKPKVFKLPRRKDTAKVESAFDQTATPANKGAKKSSKKAKKQKRSAASKAKPDDSSEESDFDE